MKVTLMDRSGFLSPRPFAGDSQSGGGRREGGGGGGAEVVSFLSLPYMCKKTWAQRNWMQTRGAITSLQSRPRIYKIIGQDACGYKTHRLSKQRITGHRHLHYI